jgi:hypothetical protein
MPNGQGLKHVMIDRKKKHHFSRKTTFENKEDVEFSLNILCQRKMEEEKM